MRTLCSIGLLVVVLFAGCKEPPITLALTHINVIDVSGNAALSDQTLLIREDRILSVRPSQEEPIHAARSLDCRGKFAIPGLWDMHVHAFSDGNPERYFQRCIQAGVTGIREMGSPRSLEVVRQYRREVESSRIAGPHLAAVAGKILNGPGGAEGPSFEIVTDPQSARLAVRRLKQEGADFIKVYSDLSRASYFAIRDEASAQRMLFAGHIPFEINATEAATAGQRSVEHLWFGCREWPQLREGRKQETADCDGVLQAFADHHTWQCPTLVLRRDSPDLDAALGLVGSMKARNVPILAGTDAYPDRAGIALHDELDLLCRAGLTPSQALQSATSRAAEFLGLDRDYGTISGGKVADLVILDANPLTDIRNTRKIFAVIRGGRILNHKE